MLKQLQIKNLAIIDELTLDFAGGFTVLTGETGAGKSILIDALSLLIGTRADSALVRAGADRAEISAEFALADSPAAADWLQQQELSDPDDPTHCLIRRVVHAEGRTRAFVNDSPVAAGALRELGETLIEIFGQNESQTLLRQDQQRVLLDEFGAYPQLLSAVAAASAEWQQLTEAIALARREAARDPAQLEYLRFQIAELDALNLQEGDIEQLDADHRRLANAGRLIDEGGLALEQLYGGEINAHDQLASVSHLLAGLAPMEAGFGEIDEMVASAQEQARAAADQLKRLLDRLDLDPAQLAELEQRLSALHDLARKHRIRADELPSRLVTLRTELEQAEQSGQRVAELETRREVALQAYRKAAKLLGAARRKAAAVFSSKVTERVRTLGMSSAQLLIAIEHSDDERPRRHGVDDVRFDFSANPGQPPRALAKVASGGELSRISLAIQVVSQQHSGSATMIFDEVDAGIGGGVAEIVGSQLRALGAQRQVLCVTHLAQVAAQGLQHYAIRKEVAAGQTYTRVQPLDASRRAEELARMLGGVEITDSIRAHAAELLTRSAS